MTGSPLFLTLMTLSVIIYLSHSQSPVINPTDLSGALGDNITFTCTAPRPNEAMNNALRIYVPEQDNFVLFENLPAAQGRLTRENGAEISTYEFGPLMSSDNNTILVCSFSGSNSANATISVIFRANITRDPASPQEDPLVLREEQSQTINLIVSANPQPSSFTWTKNGAIVTSGNGLIVTLNSFVIDPASREHAGDYRLEVVNSAGSGYFEFTLEIEYPPEFQARHVWPENANCTIFDGSGNSFVCAVAVGSSITFLCDAVGNPTPVIEHSFSGAGDPPLSGVNIAIESATQSDAGNYSCSASSLNRFPLGTTTRKFQLFVGGPPQSITDIEALINKDDNVIVFSWMYDNSANTVPATHFIVTIKLDGQTVLTATLLQNRRSYTVDLSELMADQTYIAQVVVRSLAGNSSSISEIFMTPSSNGSVVISFSILNLLLLVAMVLFS